MKRNILRFISGILICTMVVSGINPGSLSLNAKAAERNENDEVVVYSGEYEDAEDTDAYHNINLNTSFVDGKGSVFNIRKQAELPAKYDSRDDYNVTPVRNQGAYGTCWAHAAINAAESSYLKNGLYTGDKQQASINTNFSEFAFGYNYYHRKGQNDLNGNTLGDYTEATRNSGESESATYWYNRGGNNIMTSFYMVNWESPAEEDSYNRYDNITTKTIDPARYFDCQVHTQDVLFFSSVDRNYVKYIDGVKQHVMEQGSVMLSYYADVNNYFGKGQEQLYCYSPKDAGKDFAPNHAVSVVGWDDSISKSNFKVKYKGVEYEPSVDGAWLIKNSWGTAKQANGYFWLSYEDSSIDDVIGVRVESVNNYDHIFYYDGGTGVSYYKCNKGTHNYNIFTNTTGSPQIVKAGGFGINTSAPNKGIKYCMQVYKDRKPGQVSTGIPMLSEPVTGVVNWAGYYTVEFPEEIRIEPGETFSIDVWFPENDDVLVFADKNVKYGWVENHAVGSKGISFHGSADLYINSDTDEKKNNYSTIRIKAYTNEVPLDLSEATVTYDDVISYSFAMDGFNPIVVLNGVTLKKGVDYEIMETEGLPGRPGNHRVIIYGIGKYIGQIECCYTIVKQKVIVKAINTKVTKGNQIEKYKYTVDGYVGKLPEEAVKITCSANSLSEAGRYPITVSVNALNLDKECYEIISRDGILTVTDDMVVYTVSFNGLGKCDNPANQYVTFDGHAIEPKPHITGYEIEGWYLEPEFVNKWNFEKDSPKGYDVCLYAKWNELTYSIKYDKNQANITGEIPSQENNLYSQSTIISSESGYTNTKDYVFCGWNTKADGTGISYYPGDIVNGKLLGISKNGETIVLYGIWNRRVEKPELENKKDAYNYGEKIGLTCNTLGAEIHYIIVDENNAMVPTIKDSVYEEPITVKKNIILKAIAVKDGYADSEIAVFNISLADDIGDVLEEDLEKYCADGIPEGIWVAGYPTNEAPLVYDGKEKTFDVRVYDYNVLLKENVDYTYKIKNNRNACENLDEESAPVIVVKGKGNYTGVIKQKFIIKKKSIAACEDALLDELYAPDKVYIYTGQKISYKPEIINLNGKKLKYKKDFDYQIFNASGKVVNNLIVAGTYTVEYTGINNYGSSRKCNLYVLNTGNIVDDLTIQNFKTKLAYDNGNPVVQNELAVVLSDGTILKENIDYSVSYIHNKNMGTAGCIIKGLGGEYDVYGSRLLKFSIGGISLKGYKVEKFWDKDCDDEYPFVYTGEEVTVPVAIYTGSGDDKHYLSDDSYTVRYENNINAGKATVIITGIGNYSGTIKKKFTIMKADIMDATIDYDEIVGFQKGGAKPDVIVYFEEDELVLGRDYTVSYKNNKKINDRSSDNELTHPYIIVRGKGNYKGSMHDKDVPYTFEIVAKSFLDSTASVSANAEDIVVNDISQKWKSKLVISDAGGKKLKEGVDYTDVKYYFANNGKEILDDKVPSGTSVKIIATGTGNYKDEISTVYRVVDKSIEGASVLLDEKVYSSEGAFINADEITVIYEGAALKYGRDYMIESVQNNLNAGKGYVIIRGIGDYGCTKKVVFTINPKQM